MNETAEIELVIKISEEDFEIMKHNIAVNNPLCPLSQEEMVSKVANGIPLPKGHGDLIDREMLMNNGYQMEPIEMWYGIKHANTIIKADKAERRN